VHTDYRILICDDDLKRGFFEECFGEDLEARRRRQGPAARRMIVDGQISRTLSELRDALDEAADAGAPPDLVLIDDKLHPEVGHQPVRSALKAVMLIRSRFGPAAPKCVLHTSGPALNDVWAFCALGGDNVVDKYCPLDRMEILMKTLGNERWQPPQRRTDITIGGANGRLLPYMEDSHWKHNAIADLPGLTSAAADTAKRRLVAAFDLVAPAEPHEIVAAANQHGLAWVPLGARHLLAEEHPEHRETRFRHRTPGVSET
jgi:hypothetical protein